jgi:hypothetical protein
MQRLAGCRILTIVGLLAAASATARADIMLSASSTGWYDISGLHFAGNPNYIAGINESLDQFRDFFVFDLTGVSGTVTSATITIVNPLSANAAGKTYTVHEVSTPIATLEADQSGRTDIFNGLGTGTIYGSTPGTSASPVVFSLNAAGLAGLTAGEGGLFAIGGELSPLTSGLISYMYGDSDSGASVSLDLTTASVPEPSSIALLFTVVIGAVLLLRRKSGQSNA